MGLWTQEGLIKLGKAKMVICKLNDYKTGYIQWRAGPYLWDHTKSYNMESSVQRVAIKTWNALFNEVHGL